MSCFLECVLFITILPFYNRERERWRERERERERERTHTNTHTHTHTLEKKEARASELCHSNKNNQNKRYFVIVYFPSTLSPALCPQQLGSMPLPPLSPLPPPPPLALPPSPPPPPIPPPPPPPPAVARHATASTHVQAGSVALAGEQVLLWLSLSIGNAGSTPLAGMLADACAPAALAAAPLAMMISFICSCRNKNQPNAKYPKGTSHHTRLFRGTSTNDIKK
jgi:hypothetical protein